MKFHFANNLIPKYSVLLTMNIDNENNQNDRKCYNCGKLFQTMQAIERHKNRKTPCLIRNVIPEQINNPNRCIYCNKIFANIGNRNKHLKTCKIKNGGMDILVDKVKYEQEIRILKEQRDQDHEQIKQLLELQQAQAAEIEALKKTITTVPNPQTVNNIDNRTINFNAPINIVINNYTNPSIDGLTITADELANSQKLSKLLLQKLYFNPLLPQNHCIYLQNRKDKSLVIYDTNNWRMVTGDNLPEVLTKLNNTVVARGTEIINSKQGPYESSDAFFLKLPGADQQKIVNFNTLTDPVGNDDAYEVFYGGRDIVLDTIRAAGCKLV